MRFVGSDRIAAVDALTTAFRSAVERQGPRLVSIEAPQGWGKTRIVQQFYAWLASQQPEPAYWPPSLVPQEPADPEEPRKSIYPRQVRLADDAALPWMWWGIQCDRRQTGTRAQVLAEDSEQLEQHAAPFLVGREHGRRLAGDALEIGSEALGAVPFLGTPVAIGRAAQAATGAGRHAVDAVQDFRALGRRRIVDAADPARARLVARAVEILGRLADRGLPSVVVVDDAHLADPSIVALLERVVGDRSRGPILCILTAWPDRIAAQQQDREERSLGVWLENAFAFYPERSLRLELRPLQTANLAELVRERSPGTAGDVADAFARRADGNPLVLELLLRLPIVEDATRGGCIDMSLDDIAGLPADYEGILETRWQGLPSDVRTALCLCTLQGREAIHDLVLRTYDVVRPEARDEATNSVAEAVHPHAWLRRLAARLFEFSEESNLDVARRHLDGLLGERQIREAKAAIADRIVEWRRAADTRERWEPEVGRALAAIHVELARDGFAGDPASAAASAADLAEVELDAGLYRRALRLVQDALSWDRTETETRALARYRLLEGRARLHIGELGAAREALQAVVTMADADDTVDPRVALDARANLAALLLQSAQWSRARDVLERVVADATEILGADDDTTLDARALLAEAVGSAGNFAGMRRMLQEVLEDRERAFDPDHVDAVDIRTRIAALGVLEEKESWRADVEAALAHAERALGPDHPNTISARGVLADTLETLGHLREAREVAERTIADVERVLGVNHPSTLEARARLARLLVAASDPHAREVQEVTLRELDRILGPEHPSTLSARTELAVTVAALGDRRRARLALENALADHELVLGPEHVHTSMARSSLANVLLELAAEHRAAGEAEAAEEELQRARALQEATLAAWEQGFGQDSTLALQARGVLAATLHALGEADAARSLVSAAVERLEAEAGPDHAATLTARAVEARAAMGTNDLARTRGLFEALLADRGRLLGERHPETIATRSALASVIAEIEGPRRAHELHERVLVDSEAVFGAEHPRVIDALSNVAESALKIGDVERSRLTYELLAANTATVLGGDHVDTLAARGRHAEAVARRGGAAAELFDGVRRDYERLVQRSEGELGAQHPHTLRMRAGLARILDVQGLAELAQAAAPSVGGGLVAQVPDGWRFEEKLEIIALDGTGSVIARSQPTDSQDAEHDARLLGSDLEDGLRGYEELKFGQAKVFGVDGFLRRFRWDPGDGRVVQLQAYAIEGGRALTATATAGEHAFEQLRNELEDAVLKVRLERPGRLRGLLSWLRHRHGRGRRGVLRARLPAGWMPNESLNLIAPAGDANIIASIEAVDPGLDAAGYSDSQSKLMAQEFRLWKELDVLSIPVFGGRDGYLRFFAWAPADGAPVIQMQAFFAEGGSGYVATGTCLLDAFESLGTALTETVLGFRLAEDPPQPGAALRGEVLARVQERGREWLMRLPEQIAQECYERVSSYVQQLYGERAIADADELSFNIVGGGSAYARVAVHSLGDNHSTVAVLSPVVLDVEPSDELHRYLLEENGKLLFGAFSLSSDGIVVLRHSILGDSLDPEELAASVDVVLTTADEYDDVIVERFGGRTALDEAAG